MAERRLTNNIRTLRFHAGEMTWSLTLQFLLNQIPHGDVKSFGSERVRELPGHFRLDGCSYGHAHLSGHLSRNG